MDFIFKHYMETLQSCPLFHGIAEPELPAVLACLGARSARYDRGEAILAEGGPAKYIGILLSGSAQIIRIDYFGNRSIVAGIEPAGLFGESFACAGVARMPVDVIASEPAQVMLVDCRKVILSCGNSCRYHQQLIFNLLGVVARKNLVFHQKLEITSKRTTREKLMAYLLLQAKKSRSDCFEIPYNRQELADYLEVDRSGLSVEISKLCKQGLIRAERKKFTILRQRNHL
ncbi:MAG: Crp/Fnr family transcriptional regulator [Clostridium sp.]|nr:Crp/Fnr family transcriptional regulator [Clostridium sp.]